jgi:predicted NACHT family NTPase
MPNKEKDRKELLDDLVITGGGNVVGGDTIRVSGEVVNLSIHDNKPIVDLQQLKSDYLNYVIATCRTIGFKGITVTNGLSPQIPLESIYVPLSARAEIPVGETWTRNLSQTSSQDVIAIDSVLGKENRVVILGDPGSGKTTLLKNFALQLASKDDSVLPILVPLSAYAEFLTRADRNLQQFLSDYFSGRAQELANLESLFDLSISQGKAIIMLDGLDECNRQIRAHLVSKIEAFAIQATRYGNKIIVTSRIVGYREASLDSQNWSLYTLLDFNQESIEKFATKWFTAFEVALKGNTTEANQLAYRNSQIFIKAINSNPSLMYLASNPLMISVLGLLLRHQASLPLRRVDLYEKYLEILINTWNRARALDNRAVGQPLDYFQTVTVLGKLAFWLRTENPTSGIITEEQLLEWLTQYYSGDEWQKPRGEAMVAASKFLNDVRENSNILIERGQGYFGFVHLTLEEHLAARGLIQLPLEKSIEFIETHQHDPSWQEVIILAMGLWQMRGQSRIAGEIAQKMLKMGNEGVKLLGRVLNEIGEQGLGSKVTSEIQEALKNIP